MRKNVVRIFSLVGILFFTAMSLSAQRAAIITPNGTLLDKEVADKLVESLSGKLRVQDTDMSAAAFAATKPAEPFNMTADEAKRVGSAIGCDAFILVNTDTRRRASIDHPDQYEAFAAIYVVNARTGSLDGWAIVSGTAASAGDAKLQLLTNITASAGQMTESIKNGIGEGVETVAQIAELPDADSPAAKGFRPPVPYRRLKPEYTRTAYLYDVTATVEATVDLDETGQITRLAITRWAGYELDASVAKTIRSMNWRPAERGGKPLPIRFLLRYNFKKIDKDDPDNE
jgi:Periplasmic protein TonB, links inner and outer membranes